MGELTLFYCASDIPWQIKPPDMPLGGALSDRVIAVGSSFAPGDGIELWASIMALQSRQNLPALGD